MATTMTATNNGHDGHKQWPWWPQPWRPQTMTMMATTMTATNNGHDGHKQWPWWPQPWRPQTMAMMATTMTATNNGHDGHNHDDHKQFSEDGITVNLLWICQFLTSMPLVFHVFIAMVVMVYLVAVMVCGHHGIGPIPSLHIRSQYSYLL